MTFAETASESASIQAANSSINQAFASVLTAEKDGANVSRLLSDLNNAAELLAQADNAYQSGNLANVTASADNARLIANQVNNEAGSLKDTSSSQSQSYLIFTLFFSVGASLVFLTVLFVAWRRLKNGYKKGLLNLKPEVVKDSA